MTWYQRLFHPRSAAGSGRLKPDSAPADAAAQFALALNYDTGAGEIQDDAQAATWYRKAAEQGFALAQFNLAIMYDQGQGVTKDQTEAAKWFRKAADRGDAGAQFQMGKRCQRDSFDSSKDDSAEAKIEAFKWFTLSAAQGYRDSEMYLERVSLVLTREELDEAQRRSVSFLPS
jgi:TPR repeat protein